MNKTILRLPFNGTWFVMNGGDTKDINHHHGNKAQNFAFDFTVIGENGKSYKGDGSSNEDYYIFGQDILAPADGTIIESVEGVIDNLPGHGNYLAGAGNHVVIQHSDKEYSFIAHLKLNSTVVKAGQKVKAGDKIGECGNTGSSFAAHLHYHLQDSRILVSYASEFDPDDSSNGTFPINTDLTEEAQGLKPFFKDIVVNGVKKDYYSPVRGEQVGNASN